MRNRFSYKWGQVSRERRLEGRTGRYILSREWREAWRTLVREWCRRLEWREDERTNEIKDQTLSIFFSRLFLTEYLLPICVISYFNIQSWYCLVQKSFPKIKDQEPIDANWSNIILRILLLSTKFCSKTKGSQSEKTMNATPGIWPINGLWIPVFMGIPTSMPTAMTSGWRRAMPNAIRKLNTATDEYRLHFS